MLQGVLNSKGEFFKVQWFIDEIERTGLCCFYRFWRRTVGGNHDYFSIGPGVFHVTHNFQSINVRKLQVANCQMVSPLIEEFYRFTSGTCGINGVTLLHEV